jgi:hypothetical protein
MNLVGQKPLSVCLMIFCGLACFAFHCDARQSPLSKPTNLVPRAGLETVTLTWDPVPGAAGYNVYRSQSSSITVGDPRIARNVQTHIYIDKNVVADNQYWWIVTALDQNGAESPASDSVSAKPIAAGDSPTSGPSQQKSTSPTTNVGTSASSNVQTPAIKLIEIPAGEFANTSGSLTWSDSEISALTKNVCGDAVANEFDDPSIFALINVLRLSLPDSKSQQTIQSNNWYVYSRQKHWYRGWLRGWTLSDFDGSTRLYAAEKLILISILLNDQSGNEPDLAYKFTITKTQASNLASAYALLGIIIPAAVNAGAPNKPAPKDRWGCSAVPIAYKTSSIKEETTLSFGGATPFASTLTFTNEGKEWWDVSFALPVTKVNALQYSSTANTVTASQINKQSLFAVFDLYVPPTNLSTTSYNLIPHPFAGVAMTSQPLHSLLFGASIGLHLAEVYMGATLVKQQQLSGLSSGSAANPGQLTAATNYRYKAGFSFGIKISVKTAITTFKTSNAK